MWQSKSETEEKSGNIFADGVKSDPKVQEISCSPGRIDSGFFSGANICGPIEEFGEFTGGLKTSLIRAEPEGSDKLERNLAGKNSHEFSDQVQMRANSEIVEVGLTKTLNQLALKPVTVNCLRGKVQSEPTAELSPVDRRRHNSTNDEEESKTVHGSDNQLTNVPWQLYYSQDEDGDTQLHIAIVQGFHEVAMSLIRMVPHPSFFDCLNQKRQSPLHLAVLTHQSSIARRLILAGADPTIRNSDGNTALHLAAASGDLSCAKALTDPILLSERKYLVQGRQTPRIPQDLEQRNHEGETCLHAAVVAGNTDMVRLLICVGADLEAKERLGGRTALHLSIECRRSAVTSLLLKECNPHLDALTYGGITAYEIASCSDSQLAKELLKLGASAPLKSQLSSNGSEESVNNIPQPHWQGVGLRV